MRKVLPLLVVGFLVLSGLGAVAIPDSETTEIEKASFSFSQPVLKDEKEFISLDIPEANSFIMKQGKPMLPSYTHTFVFEFGTKIKSVSCTPKNIQTQTVSKDIMPTPKAVIAGQTVSQNLEPINYGSDPYPDTWYTYDVGCGRYNGDLSIIVDIEFSPIKYYPVDKTIEWAKEVEITIEYEPSSWQSMAREQYNLIVIAPDEYSDELAPLITHKNGRGVSAKFVGLNEVYGGTGRDNPEKIKYYIKDAIEDWTTGNVLLVGSSSKLPARETHIYFYDPPSGQEDDEIFVSDLYYADIYDENMEFCSWDSNGNNVFGEYDWEGEYDDVDLHPDVYLGRWACTSGSQVTACVNKVKTYEDNEAYKQDWFTNLVVLGGDTSPDYDVIEGEYINDKVINMMDGFTPTRLWVTNGKLTSLLPTGVQNIKEAINAGCGFVDFSGHGNTFIWATHPEEDHKWVPTPLGGFRTSDVKTLSNGNKLPIIAVEACSTAKFNADSDCYNWAYMYDANGGAIGAYGATALGWGYVGSGISQGLIGKMGLDTFRAYAYDDSITLGEMWSKALERYIDSSMESLDYKVTEEWILFGDPTLQIGEESNPPAKPQTPSGPPSGNVGTQYTYTTSTTDPDEDKVAYNFDWGDGTTSGWTDFVDSGATGSAKKTWYNEGTYKIRAVAKDEHGKMSDWSNEFTVTMPRSRAVNYNSFILKFLENHPNIFPILRQLLGL